ncbi:uncharacterized protein BYT42DRAFT_551629 [Radiomyces spectabilis]|uniref:uncharacterized protein n=1 Tax=Radiomyces spectabilis TaxID=64574 RepID=UPI00221F6F50|nr:uncharacterized protein BYT42DRAFT_551629 [Radiomyces spectabilis]KAI8393604.1 hypothetical protein BYT42DRAFT_551629 [Radiomyces spectabilis]
MSDVTLPPLKTVLSLQPCNDRTVESPSSASSSYTNHQNPVLLFHSHSQLNLPPLATQPPSTLPTNLSSSAAPSKPNSTAAQPININSNNVAAATTEPSLPSKLHMFFSYQNDHIATALDGPSFSKNSSLHTPAGTLSNRTTKTDETHPSSSQNSNPSSTFINTTTNDHAIPTTANAEDCTHNAGMNRRRKYRRSSESNDVRMIKDSNHRRPPRTSAKDEPDDPTKTDIDKHIRAMNWYQKMQLSDDIWNETCDLFLCVRETKTLKSRGPNRKCIHILASILYILCRKYNNPRTFAEICTAAGIKKHEIGVYYRLMLKLLEPTGFTTSGLRTTDIEEFLKRWCSNLHLEDWVARAAMHVFQRAYELNLMAGKCPISIGAASICLCCQGWQSSPENDRETANDAQANLWRDQRDIALAAGVVSVTLITCYRVLWQHRSLLFPQWFINKICLHPE